MLTPRWLGLSVALAAVICGAGCIRRAPTVENILRIALPINLRGLDPAHAGDEATDAVIPNLYEGLLRYDLTKRPAAIEPLLAESLPHVDDDGLTVTFKIKAGVHFQDSEVFPGGTGREVTAQDFIYSWKRLTDPHVRSEGAWLFAGKIRELSAPNNQTLVIRLIEPWPGLNAALTQSFAAVVPREAVEKLGADFAAHPVGTGPYVLDVWFHSAKLILRKNPQWHADGRPAPDQLEFFEIIDNEPRQRAFAHGDLDIIAEAGELTYLGFNMADPLVGRNLNLRRALAVACGGQSIVEKFGLKGARAAQAPGTPGADGHDPEFRNPWLMADAAKAKDLLKKAGFPGGKGLAVLHYLAVESAADHALTDYLARQLYTFGIRLNVEFKPWPLWLADVQAGKAQIFLATGRSENAFDAMGVFQLLYSQSASPGPNLANYRSPEFDAFFVQAARQPPGPERAHLLMRLRDVFVRDLPWIPLAQKTGFVTTQPWVTNVNPDASITGYYKDLRVDLAKKQQLQGTRR